MKSFRFLFIAVVFMLPIQGWSVRQAVEYKGSEVIPPLACMKKGRLGRCVSYINPKATFWDVMNNPALDQHPKLAKAFLTLRMVLESLTFAYPLPEKGLYSPSHGISVMWDYIQPPEIAEMTYVHQYIDKKGDLKLGLFVTSEKRKRPGASFVEDYGLVGHIEKYYAPTVDLTGRVVSIPLKEIKDTWGERLRKNLPRLISNGWKVPHLILLSLKNKEGMSLRGNGFSKDQISLLISVGVDRLAEADWNKAVFVDVLFSGNEFPLER